MSLVRRYSALLLVLAVSSHGNPFRAVAGPPYLAEGEISVVRPLGSGKFESLARIRLEDWASLSP